MVRNGWILYLLLIPLSVAGQSLTVVVNGHAIPPNKWSDNELTTLPAREATLQINLYPPTNKDVYSYRLQQSNPADWQSINANTTILYHNLSGDEYTFEIRRGIELPFFKHRFFVENALWQRWWFGPSLFLYGLFILGVLMYLF